jgi:hypothetical protein
MMDFTAILKTVAPWLGTALGGPLGGMAVSFIADKMGLQDKTVDAVKAAILGMTPEQALALKTGDQEFALHMQELGFKQITDLEALAVKDRDSARQREVALKDNTNKVLAAVIVGGFMTMVGATLMGWTRAESVMAGTLIGYLSAKADQVLSYYFGSNKESARKTELIAQAPAVKE